MDFKASISNSGEEKLFKPLSNEVERRLPNATVEWKRSYGRPSKQVVLQANFSKFDATQLSNPVNTASGMGSKHLLHIFWTSCMDNDTYKSWAKNSIARWQKQLQESSITDWLIIHVMYQENNKSGKPKIQLPRTSVFDKMKTDFGQKIQERCIQLWEPDKETLFTKSGESWEALLTQLRSLLLESFGRQLDKFEDKIRMMREKYANPDWPFLDYFIVHEELALIYQSIMLREDALVQYDEVDALLSQFIINSSGKDLPKWLKQFCITPKRWDGVVLNKQTADLHRGLIKNGKIGLLDFRNYLFSRQCKLLIKNKRKWEVPSRLLEFLFTLVHELKLLKVEMSKSAIACWIILTCMHLFDVLESFESKDPTFNATMAQLHDYMRQKLLLVGMITGLYFGRTQTSVEKDRTAELLSGFVSDTTPSVQLKQLRLALSCQEEFEKFYLDATNITIESFISVKRLHFAMVVGIDLAKFHLQRGRYIEAEPLLEKAWSVFKQQKWESLYTDVLIPLADCQLKHNLHERYLNAVTLLSCAQCLSESTRQYYSNELLRLAGTDSLNLPVLSTDPVLKLLDVRIDLVKHKGHIGDEVNVHLSIRNELVEVLPCKQITIFVRHYDLNNPLSFSDDIPSPRKSIFDQTDYGMSISLSSTEKQPAKENVKEPLTPSGLLKRIKSHRRTWSKNKNIIDTSDVKNESKTTSSASLSNSESLSQILDPLNNGPSSKKALFTISGDGDERKSLSNGQIKLMEDSESKLSLFELASNSDKSNMAKAKNRNSIVEAEDKMCNGIMLSKPLATSSVSENHTKVEHITLPDDDKNTPSGSCSSLEESSLFVPQETEAVFDQILSSSINLSLKPGLNEITLSGRIMNEGKYILQYIHCFVGHLTLYKSLTPRKNPRAFFMVADPPKIAWTSDYVIDYLLTGSKQRLHVTLLNGPGVITEGSTLRVTSNSGLLFYPLDSSSIKIYPMERNGIPREAAISITTDTGDCSTLANLKIPACKPFERINVYFDVVAPVHRTTGESSQSQHEINFWYLWLKELVNSSPRLDCIFYEPFQVNIETIHKNDRVFVKITLCGVNPVPLMFSSPQLYAISERLNLFSKLSSDEELYVFGNEQCHLLWEIKGSCEDTRLECLFKVHFTTKNNDEKDMGCFEQTFIVNLRQCHYIVEVQISEERIPRSKPCKVTVNIKRNTEKARQTYRIFLTLNPEDISWRSVKEEANREVIFEENKTECDQEFELVTDNFDFASLPMFTLMKAHDMNGGDEAHFLEVRSQFSKGEVDYHSIGRTVMTYDDVIITKV